VVGGPGNGLDGGLVGGKGVEGFIVCAVPDEEFVVVSAGCELAFFRVPAETADFLFVGGEFAKVVVGYSYVSVEDRSVS
jgi:hypothetical protein